MRINYHSDRKSLTYEIKLQYNVLTRYYRVLCGLAVTGFCLFWFHLNISPLLIHYLAIVEDPRSLFPVPSASFFYGRVLSSDESEKEESESTGKIDIPVYFINLNQEEKRRDYIKDRLRTWKFKKVTRVSAWTDEDVRQYVTSSITSLDNIARPNDKEIACIASHLYAMYLAVTDTSNDSPYALIMEDDLNMEMEVDWSRMLEKAPEDFAILQLMTSNSESVSTLWKEYLLFLHIESEELYGKQEEEDDNNHPEREKPLLREVKPQILRANPFYQWKKRSYQNDYWSTQAYIISKESIKNHILQFISLSFIDHHYHIHLPMPEFDQHYPCYDINNKCVLPFRLVADILLYSYFQPTYITRIPFLNGASASASIGDIKNRRDSGTGLELQSGEAKEVRGSLRGHERKMIEETTTIADRARVERHEREFHNIHNQIEEIVKDYMNVIPEYFSKM